MPREARRSITRVSSLPTDGGAPIRTETTQSWHFTSLTTQESQSIIMAQKIRVATDIASTVATMSLVRANLVVARNGATTLAGSSRALSNKLDRQRFHQLRANAEVILVGGNTFRSEPYNGLAIPILVSTRFAGDQSPGVEFHNLSPSELVKEARSRFNSILIEGGLNFLFDLIKFGEIDEIFLTRSPKLGDADFLDEIELTRNYSLTKSEVLEDVTFEEWHRA